MFQRALFLTLLVMAFAVGGPSVTHAASPTIAMVDVDKILAESKAAKSLQTQIQAKKDTFQKEFAAKEKELKTTETSLLAEQGKIPAEDFNKKRKAYEEKIIETQKLFKKRRNSLDEGLNKAMQELRKNIVEASAGIADEKGYDIVLTRESVLLAEKSLDITDDVLKALDAKLADIKLQVE